MARILGALHDLQELRAARALVAAERFARSQGRWPRDLTEALGRAPEPWATNPFDGAPLELVTKGDGAVRVVGRTPLGDPSGWKLMPLSVGTLERGRAAPSPP
jgi:hypothetical protein